MDGYKGVELPARIECNYSRKASEVSLCGNPDPEYFCDNRRLVDGRELCLKNGDSRNGVVNGKLP